MFNSGFMQEVSTALALRVEKACGADRTCSVNTAWQLALARRPRPTEAKLAADFFRTGGTLAEFSLALLNRNEFLYVP